MNLPVNIDGRQVEFTLNDETQRFRPGSSVALGELVTDIIVKSFTPIIASTVKAIIVSITRTVFEITVEVSANQRDARVTRRIALQTITARKFSNFLIELNSDHSWDLEVKRQLEESLRQDLRAELGRLRMV